ALSLVISAGQGCVFYAFPLSRQGVFANFLRLSNQLHILHSIRTETTLAFAVCRVSGCAL
ncbi:hypothetical protein N5C36_14720, partial [Shewanella xiamenensis]|uniref:hypothetical protein n=1 Tax=Shewanella xiamenensis TaxID=332186 RepID=UPI00244A0AC0